MFNKFFAISILALASSAFATSSNNNDRVEVDTTAQAAATATAVGVGIAGASANQLNNQANKQSNNQTNRQNNNQTNKQNTNQSANNTSNQSNGQNVSVVTEGTVVPDRVRTVPDVVLGSPATVVCGGVSGGFGVTTLGGGLVANIATVNEKCDIRENIRILSSILPALPAAERAETLQMIMHFISKLREQPAMTSPVVNNEDTKVRN